MKTIRTLLITALVLLTAGCGTTNTVPITGRKTHLLVSDAEILSLSSQQYQEYMKSSKVSYNCHFLVCLWNKLYLFLIFSQAQQF